MRFLTKTFSKRLWIASLIAIVTDILLLAPGSALADVAGQVTGIVRDQSGASVPNVAVTITNKTSGVTRKTTTNSSGNFTFLLLPVGAYQIDFNADLFQPYSKKDFSVDLGTAAQLEIVLTLAAQTQTVNVTENTTQVETADTQLGQVIASKQITDVPLNGRSYTDLFALQGGVTPISTSGASNSSSGGGFGTVPVAGSSNTGQFSINGQRESANGFYLNGASVQETIGQQAGIIPNLDAISEFRILTSNSSAEYGGFSGGLINVVTKSGGNSFHGSLFEFLRNTDFDARGFFDPQRGSFQQNQYGGTFGGPIIRNKLFFFGDYQGQQTIQGIETGLIAVPSLAERSGNFQDAPNTLTGNVNGPYLAQLLQQRLGYPITYHEPFYFQGCTSNALCVFPNAVVPQRALAVPAQRLLQYIPLPNFSANQFSSGSQRLRLEDGRGSGRLDASTSRYGTFSAYYFLDRYHENNPYPSGFGGATVPGFNALSNGQDQLVVLSHTMSFGASAVNEGHVSFTRLYNNLGIPDGGVGVSLADQGISSGPTGIKQGFPQYAGVETLYFNNFTVGTNPFSLVQVNNTYQASDNFSKVVGNHTMKFGGEYLRFNVKQLPNLVANGTFTFAGSGTQSTGNGFADFLLGLPDYYSQQSSPAFYERSVNAGLFAEDSWHVTSNLTLNYGVRWDVLTPWSEQHNQTTTLIPGRQSVVFPGAPEGYLVPGDPGVPATISPIRWNDFSPRLGLAYSPGWSSGLLAKLTGGPGKTSIRLGAGRFFTSIEGLSVAYPTGNPPYGLTYTSPEPPEMSQPFVGALTGKQYVQQFPVNVPPYNVSVKNPDTTVDWSRYVPIGGAGSVNYENKTPYSMTLNFTLERQVGRNWLAGASYVGTLGRHLLTVVGANPGVPATCLSLNQPSDVAPGTPTCGPFGENQIYTRANGQVVNGTRSPFNNEISSDAWYATWGNSNYNALDLTLKRTVGPLTMLASYTYGKSLDWSSNFQEQIDPYNYRKSYGLSAFDLTQNFVVSYNYQLPLDKLFHTGRLTTGWAVSGISRFATGLPVTFQSLSDNYLVNVQNNGVNAFSVDLPDVKPGPLEINHNPRGGQPYFNTTLFTPNALGTPGNSSRRFFHGPGVDNYDIALRKLTRIAETKTIELRFETFNTFNHAQFYGNGAVDGNVDSATFGRVLHAAAPRIIQLGLKVNF